MSRLLIALACLLLSMGMALAATDTQKTLIVGSEEDFPPFSIGKTDQEAGGFTVDLWKDVAREAGLKYAIRVRPWGQILQEFRDGKIDVLINVAKSEARHRYTDFSVPHVTVNGAIFVRKGDSRFHSEADLAGKSIIVFKSDLAHEYAISKGWQKQLVLVGNSQEGLKLLASGKCDVMLLSKLAGMQTIRALNLKNVEALDVKTGYAQNFSFGVHKGDSDLLARINEGLALSKANGDYDALYQKWFGIYETKEPTFRDMLKYLGPFAALVVCLGGYFFYRRNVERTLAGEELQKSNSFNQSIIDSSTDCIQLLDLGGRLRYMSPEGQRMHGFRDTAEFLNRPYEDFWKGKHRDAAMEAISNARSGHRGSFEGYCPALDGTPKWWEVIISPVNGPDGNPEKLLTVSRDISNRKLMEENLRKQTIRLEEELVEREVAQEALQDQAAMLEEEIEERRLAEEALQKSEATIRNKLKAILEPEGDIGTLELSDIIDCEMLRSMLEDFYRITGMLGAVLDLSGKVLVAVGWQDICTKFHRCHPETLKHCIESDTTLTNDVPVGTFKHYRCKNNMWDMVTPLEVGGRHVGNIFIGQFFYDDEIPDVELFRAQARRYGFNETEYLEALERVPRFSRETADAGMQFYAKLTKMISELSFSSIQLSRILAERIRLEEQLRHSQKMEAVGELAGGVAHDFNNILQIISGYAHILKMDGGLDERQKEEVDHILSSSEKAAHLTKGLLAFSRKQVMALKPVNLNDAVENVKKILVRIIGEDIQLKTLTFANRIMVYADTGQIEQVLINLATNARDAMRKGGTLTIEIGLQTVEAPVDHESGSARPGRYAVMAVSDTGVGMDAETSSRIFEPFYTTKEVGKGTGLGMSIVYGIIKQHNGFINVYSEQGQGTTFKIYLPVYVEDHSGEEGKGERQDSPPQGGSETILLAEDDEAVRKLNVTVLTRFGYRVIQAVDGQDAVEKFSEHKDDISLILMDMIMPKKNGKDAFEEISLLQPNVKILYSSGYTADFIQNRGVSEEGIELIMKPVQPMDLLRKVREMLDSK